VSALQSLLRPCLSSDVTTALHRNPPHPTHGHLGGITASVAQPLTVHCTTAALHTHAHCIPRHKRHPQPALHLARTAMPTMLPVVRSYAQQRGALLSFLPSSVRRQAAGPSALSPPHGRGTSAASTLLWRE
jgi:hypothetical protein